MRRLINRGLSSFIFITYLYFAFMPDKNIGVAARAFVGLLLPMACIWFSEVMANHIESAFSYSRRYISEKSPAGCVFILGWFILLIPGIIAIYAATQN